ncbi:type 1 glutamine amidotransferase domain-containing protein [Cupriavidus gilardii]|uniref:type 1 glutamine amidotransferase domain-containing protein n=1 Tax=Cupriavidus gilardii TaxID=82541 RepID=UPI00158111EF|nr:type 1 glutamine amidotransferase domain-containing protein [Cupriavidus gilardii]MCT9071474.1 type 1 glutamine amidotransferase domain-containing protein [Cupriavidus gilardii]QKS61558.1 type 1 glutamine amidotransferase domain-containing protein [Cupriavidus gilardii]
MPAQRRILVVATNVDQYQKVGFRTGLWLSELTHFWDVAEEAGHTLQLASPSGGKIPIDPESLMLSELARSAGMRSSVFKRYEDRIFMDVLNDTVNVASVDPGEFDAIYLTGGHGVMFDFPGCEPLARLIAAMYEQGRVVAAVCHGPAGLLDVRLGNGELLVQGKRVTGFSWNEEIMAKRDFAVPFGLEQELGKRGAQYSKAMLPFAPYVVEDGRLITGQNPGSAYGVAKAVLRTMRLSEPAAEPA